MNAERAAGSGSQTTFDAAREAFLQSQHFTHEEL